MGRTGRPRSEPLAWLFALAVAIAPLWAARDLPLVDLPQHSYALAVLGHLDDPATRYPGYFEARPGLRPYLGYYAVAAPIARVLSIDVANRVFLSIIVAAFPLAVAFLLCALGRPSWPALLAVPFAYGDAFGWGYLNYCASLPLLFACLALWLRLLADARRRPAWLAALLAGLLALAVTHPGPVFFLALAFPFLLLTTPVAVHATARGAIGWIRARAAPIAVLAWCGFGAGIFAASVALRSRTVASAVARGDWAGLLAQRHFEFRPAGESLRAFPDLLAGLLRDGSDRAGPVAVAGVALAAVVASRVGRRRVAGPARPWLERARPPGLVAIAIGLYLALPLHIFGLVGDLSTRFAPIVAALAAGLVPRLGDRPRRVFVYLAAAASLATAVPLVRGFRAFERESGALREMIAAAGDRPVVMGLVHDPGSRVVRHPVYLHAAATLARARGGIPNYTLAGWRISPIRYRVAPPPSYPDEWRPEGFDHATMGAAYDHFLGRGRPPGIIFGERLGGELRVAARAGDWWLVRRDP